LTDKSKSVSRASLWDWVKAISTLTMVGVFSYKVYLTPVELTVDFPTLLSLLLALFSVALAALFYFKATDTSNTFYDNTYNFTKDIAQLLAKIESGFGEKLRNLDEGYSSMRDYLQSTPGHNGDIETAKEKIAGEEEEIEKVIAERNKIVNSLIDKAQLQAEDKEKIISELSEKESELVAAQRELSQMKKRLFMDRMQKREEREEREISHGLESFTSSFLIDKMGADKILNLSQLSIRRHINDALGRAPHQYIEDLERHGFFDNGINKDGVRFVRRLAQKHLQ
tara:strand:- start:2456 stop:3304 length:849 start_codon:yes stop_codon:yes gene_type:complete